MKKGLKPLIAGAVLFVLGGAAAPLVFVWTLVWSESETTQFMVPGEADFDIETSGRYYLWNDYQTVFNGESYHRTESLPDGLKMQVYETAGETLSLVSDASITSSVGSSSKQSIAYVDIPRAGKWTVEVTGDVAPRVFSFAPSPFMRVFLMLFGGLACSIIVALVGVIIAVIGLVRLLQNG